MKKYFKDEPSSKLSLSEYWMQIVKEYQEIAEKIRVCSCKVCPTQEELALIYELKSKQRGLSLTHARMKLIYSSLGDIQISKDMLDTICETFDSSKCRYGTICLKPETIKGIYEISEIFPELSREAILLISREYIKDLFDMYSLVETLAIMLRKEGKEDTAFEKFMDVVLKFADEEEKKYNEVAGYIRIYCGQYTYDFVRHFERFVKEHHISWTRFLECLPSPELILKDQLELNDLARKTKDCWGICEPITFKMLEDYLDGDTKLKDYEEQPSYYISTYVGKVPTSFTKTQFIESIQENQKVLTRK